VIRAGLAVLALPLAAVAQTASSPHYFLTTMETAPGGAAQTSRHQLHAGFGSGVVPAAAGSTEFQLVGGTPAMLDVYSIGTPWLSGLSEWRGPLGGGVERTLHGTELDLGPSTAVRIGGAPAQVQARSRDQLRLAMPAHATPGRKDIEVVNDGGTMVLPGATGVLPLLDFDTPYAVGEANRLACWGTSGDQVLWLVAAGIAPVPYVLPGYGHALELELGTLLPVRLVTVSHAEGVAFLALPALASSAAVWVQGFVLSPSAGYGPGSFTNVLRL
jgi:hypothetical protein